MNNREIYEELKADFKKNNKNSDKHKILIYSILLFIFAIPFIVLAIFKPREYINSFDDIPEPTQIPASWWTSIIVNWDEVVVDFLAEYDVQWRVLAVAQYWGNIFERIFKPYYLEDNIIRYRDVWIWWWYMAQDDYADRFNRRSSGRFLYPGVKTYEDYYYMFDRFSWEEINRHISHNHLIPANNRIKKFLHWIEKWQYIHIKWYLVRLHWDNWYNLTSSLTREDQWDGACETIYVTEVSRLKKK